MMKKLLFCVAFIAFAFYANAQTVIYEDDFESYTVGVGLAEQSEWWILWPDMPDAPITTAQAQSGTKSVEFVGTNDVVLPMGKVSGKYQVEFSYYVPSGFAAYYNFQRLPTPGVEWVVEVYFANNGTGFIHANGQNAATFTYPQNQWVHIKNIIDIDADWGEVYINNNLIHGWQWSKTSQGATSPHGPQLGGLNIFSGAPTGQTPTFYFDDIIWTELEAGNLPEIVLDPTEFDISIQPLQIVNETLNVENIGNALLEYSMEINYVFPGRVNQPVASQTEFHIGDPKTTVFDLIYDAAAIPGGDNPDYPENVILNYDGPNFTGVGFPNPTVFEVAAKFPNSHTLPHAGMELTEVDLYIYHTDNCSFKIKIYGEGTPFAPGALLLEQTISPAFPGWHTYVLNTPITITGEDLWIGYWIAQAVGGIFPIGADEGPADPNGHYIKPGAGWTVSNLDYNWNIRGKLTGDGIEHWLSLAPASGELDPLDDEDHIVTFDASNLMMGEYHANIKVNSNDPANPQIIVPVELNVGSGIEDPTIVVNPTSMSQALEPDATAMQELNISNIGLEDLTFTIDIEYIAKNGQRKQFYFRDLGYGAGNPLHTETDLNAEPRIVEGTRDMWDLQFVYDVQAGSNVLSHAGSETDGNYFYTARWNGPEIHKFDLDGNFIETFTITGVSGVRDMAFDGTYFYGSNATAGTGIWQMDFVNKVLVSTIPYTGAVRAIAYDEVADGFWVNNWSSALTLVSRTGTIIQVGPTTPSCYGIAYDLITPGGPYMWLFTGTTSDQGCQVEQMAMPSGTLTGVSHSVSGDLGANHIAGGLWIFPNLIEGTVTLGGCVQGEPNKVFGYEILEISIAEGWLSADPLGGTLSSGQNMNIEIGFDATDMEYGEYLAHIVISSNDPANPVVEVPVTLIVSDQTAPVIIIDPMSMTQAMAPNQVETQEMTVGNEGVGTLLYDISIQYGEELGPEDVLLDEGFEGTTFPPAGWLKLNPDAGTGWITLNVGTTPIPGWKGGEATAAPNGGSKMAFCTWDTGGPTLNNQWLITPQITVGNNTILSFWMRYWPNTFIDNVDIRLSTTVQNNVNAFNIVVDALTFSTGSSTEWEYYEYNLADFVTPGTNVYIAFREHVLDNFNDGAVIFLDNVMVVQTLSWLSVSQDGGAVEPMDEDLITVTFNSAGLELGVYNASLMISSNDPDNSVVEVPVTLDVITGVNELGEPNAVMVYPNPATDHLRIQANHSLGEIKLYTSTGQLVVSQRVDGQSANINTTDLAPGLYLLQIETEAGISSRKIMIK